MAIIAISHMIGSCGREIGRKVAQQLGLDYVDREIVEGVAHKLGIPETVASRLDEKADHLIEQIFSNFRYQIAGATGQIKEEDLIDTPTYHEATQAVLQTVAAGRKGAVIAGHGANFALAERPGLLSVFVYAPVQVRIERLMKREIISQAEAAKRLHHNDGERAHYIKSLYRANWRDPDFYHLMINTAFANSELAANLIIQAARQRYLIGTGHP